MNRVEQTGGGTIELDAKRALDNALEEYRVHYRLRKKDFESGRKRTWVLRAKKKTPFRVM